jgi:hypothetical protein
MEKPLLFLINCCANILILCLLLNISRGISGGDMATAIFYLIISLIQAVASYILSLRKKSLFIYSFLGVFTGVFIGIYLLKTAACGI